MYISIIKKNRNLVEFYFASSPWSLAHIQKKQENSLFESFSSLLNAPLKKASTIDAKGGLTEEASFKFRRNTGIAP